MRRLTRWGIPVIAAALILAFPTAASAKGRMDEATLSLAVSEISADSGQYLTTASLSGEMLVSDFQRTVLVEEIAHYSFKLRFGPGPYDVMRMHRIVKEKKPFMPVKAKDGILLMHGDILGIEGAWMGNLTSPGVPADHAFPIFLAGNGIDVWGVDMGWVLVPAEETDFSFMEDWGYAKDIQQMELALRIARSGRAATGSGKGMLFTLGWSQGAGKLFAYASEETQLPPGRRQVRGYIPVDMFYKFTDESMREAACADYTWFLDMKAAGEHMESSGSFFIFLGELAEMDPAGDSPVFPGWTNYTAALMFGAIPFGFATSPYYHLVAGEFDSAGLATGLQYSSVPFYFDWLQGAAPYEPLQVEYEVNGLSCDGIDMPWDDHLGEITAPILFVLAAGGIWEPGYQTEPFLTNADLTTLYVRLHPPGDEDLDFAHVDLWIADDAEALVWQPILDWILAQ